MDALLALGQLQGCHERMALTARVLARTHAQIKPENFLVGPAGEIKVCDLGLARDMHHTRMQTEHMGGSSIYIAPGGQ